MSLYILLNTIRLASGTYLAGCTINDAQDPIVDLVREGASLAPFADASATRFSASALERRLKYYSETDPGAPVPPAPRGTSLAWDAVFAYDPGSVVTQGNQTWVAKTASTAASPIASPTEWQVVDGGTPQVATVVELALVSGIPLVSGAMYTVNSKLQPFMLDKLSVKTPNGRDTIAALGGGNWERVQIPVPRWTAQTTWYLDAVSGDDDATGATSLLPVKTVAEIGYRLRVVDNATTYTINCLNATTAVASTDYVHFDGSFGSLLNTGVPPTIIINGLRTVLFTGTLTGATVAVPGTNTRGSLADTTMTVATYLGRRVIMTSGAASGATAGILKDLGSNTWQTSEFVVESTGSLSSFPSIGDTYTVVSETLFSAPVPGRAAPTGINLELKNVEFPAGSSVNAYGNIITFRGTRHLAAISSPVMGGYPLMAFVGSIFHYASITTALAVVEGTVEFNAGGSINARFQVMKAGLIRPSNFTAVGGSFRSFPHTGNIAPGGTILLPLSTKLGIFDAPASEPGLSVQRGATAVIGGTLYGTTANATYGAVALNGGRIMVLAAVTPTITGASGDLLLDGATTAMPTHESDTQFGTGTLITGASANITANLTASSRILITAVDGGISSAIGRLAAPSADRVTGAAGTFKVRSYKADATAETNDVSTFDWEVRPSLYALTTWAQWAAAPFSRNAVSTKTLSAITNLT